MSIILILVFACFYRISAEQCPRNEQLSRCGTACEPSCLRPAPEVCIEECFLDGCRCKPGFFRNFRNECVRSCAGEPCGPNMERLGCGLPESCEPVCTPVKNLKCRMRCIRNGCQCKPGYIRNFPGGDCIPVRHCKSRVSVIDDHKMLHRPTNENFT
ncbi:hypothetical protein RB195_015785 [Necator americanus]|uniref:TIL domain-containing protein n=1 Tax=Necator americanus TaxID=51031 RepID=A0ABR1E7B3_NECAM